MNRALDFGHLVELCRRTHEETQRSAARAADTYLVTRNWLFGWYIVEYEQRGVDRAKYGSRLLVKVSRRLQEAGIKGCSATHLKLCRQFHQQQKRIGQTLSDQFTALALEGRTSSIGQTPSDQLTPPASDARISPIGPTPSDQFASIGLKGCSPTNLRKPRELYRAYPEIRQTLSVESIAGRVVCQAAVELGAANGEVETVGKKAEGYLRRMGLAL